MKKLSVILIIAGIIIAVSPLAGQIYTSYNENKLIDEWLKNEDTENFEASDNINSNIEENFNELQEAFSTENSKTSNINNAGSKVSPSSEATTTEKPKTEQKSNKTSTSKTKASQKVLGVILIDKIKLKAPIVEGANANNLKAGIGHIPGTAAVGKSGNCALAGHRSYTFGRFFNRLDELIIGDKISIMTKKEDLKYEVYEKIVVKPDDISVIKGSKEDNIITLVTCTPIYKATHRLIIHARLIDCVVKEQNTINH